MIYFLSCLYREASIFEDADVQTKRILEIYGIPEER